MSKKKLNDEAGLKAGAGADADEITDAGASAGAEDAGAQPGDPGAEKDSDKGKGAAADPQKQHRNPLAKAMAEAQQKIDEAKKIKEKAADIAGKEKGASTEPEKTAPAPEKTAAGTEPEKFKPLTYWTAEEKAFFEKLPEESKGMVLGMYKNIQKVYEAKTNEFNVKIKGFSEINSVLAPYDDFFRQNRISKGQYVNALVSMDKRLTADPVTFIIDIMADRGIDMEMLTEGVKMHMQRSSDPQYRKMAQSQRKAEQYEQQFAAQAEQQALQYIEQLKTATDENGNLKYPYFEDVQDQMAQIMAATGEQDIEKVYKEAVWLNPTIRQKLIDGEKNAVLEQNKKAALAEKQKEAAALAVKKPLGAPGAKTTAAVRSLKQIIADADNNPDE